MNKKIIPILAIIFAVLAAVVVIYFGFVQGVLNQNENTNTNTNAVAVNQNANAVVDVNPTANNNSTANTNSTTNRTTGWKTYTNAKYYYSIKYPAAWHVTNCSDIFVSAGPTPVICNSDGGSQGFDVSAAAGSSNFTSEINNLKANMVSSQQTKRTVAGISADRLTGQVKPDIGPGSNNYTDTVYLSANGYVYSIGYAVDGLIDQSFRDDFEAFLDNFTLTNPTAGWKTYTNTDNGYSIQYPSDWVLDRGHGSNPVPYIRHTVSNEVYGGDGDISISLRIEKNITESLASWFSTNKELTPQMKQTIVNGPCAGTADVNDIVSSVSDSQVGGLDAKVQYEKDLQPTYCEGPANTSKSYYVKKGTSIYWLLAVSPTGQKSEGLIKVFDTMVSTFTFTK